MNKIIGVACVFLIILCSSVKAQQVPETNDPDNLAKEYFSQIMGVATSATTNTKMYQFIYDWIGTPYRLGGSSKSGVDCSKFVAELYDQVFNTSVGYNSRNIYSKVDVKVAKSDLQPGDFVFFKIRSRSISHIGVYLGDDRFAHASSSRGVMISNLNDAYWRRYYYNGGRVLTAQADEAQKQDDALKSKD